MLKVLETALSDTRGRVCDYDGILFCPLNSRFAEESHPKELSLKPNPVALIMIRHI